MKGVQHQIDMMHAEKERVLPRSTDSYFVFGFGFACDKALPAAVLLAAPVLPSRRTFEAADAAFGLVCFVFAFAIVFLLSSV